MKTAPVLDQIVERGKFLIRGCVDDAYWLIERRSMPEKAFVAKRIEAAEREIREFYFKEFKKHVENKT